MRIAVGSDHAGYELKAPILEWLRGNRHNVIDLGAHAMDPLDDYPDFAAAVARS